MLPGAISRSQGAGSRVSALRAAIVALKDSPLGHTVERAANTRSAWVCGGRSKSTGITSAVLGDGAADTIAVGDGAAVCLVWRLLWGIATCCGGADPEGGRRDDVGAKKDNSEFDTGVQIANEPFLVKEVRSSLRLLGAGLAWESERAGDPWAEKLAGAVHSGNA